MIAATKVPCPQCGHANRQAAPRCGGCGAIRARVRHDPQAVPFRHVAPPVLPRCEPHKVTVGFLIAGIAIALAMAHLPIAQFMGWFFTSLCHEMGHCAAAWLAGCPAFPAIRLDGHAAARHLGQSLALCVGIWLAIAALAWRFRHSRRAVVAFGGLALLYPLFAFTSMRELVFLLSGQGGELVFAGVFLWRGLVGGFSESRLERAMYFGCACLLLGSNFALHYGLVADPATREMYRTSGSFGLTNDYVRAARQLGTSLEAVAGLMMLLALATAPTAWWLSRPRRRGRAQSY